MSLTNLASDAEKLADPAKAAAAQTPADPAAETDGGSAVAAEDAVSRKELRPAEKREGLYADRVKIHPKKISGTFRRLKWAVLIVLLGLYYLVPWLRWDRGPDLPDQALLLDIAGGKGYIFWLELWPQEVYYITGLLILAAVGLFLATSLFGRVWCGYACPQTVWTDLFMLVERLIEGDRGARMRLDKAPMSAGKLLKRATKHTAWLLISVATGGALIFYVTDAPTTFTAFFTGQASSTVYGFVGLFTATTYLLAGMAREQVCTYMCPWPRFQAAMMDEDSMIVTYEGWRGEPRGPHKKGQSWEGRGDCIDCRQCVAVCPTGIDIRDGVQLECIGCALCIDACNEVMDKVGRPRNLIRYDTERNQDRRAQNLAPTFRLVRPRTLIYGSILVIVASALLWMLAVRSTLDVNLLHDRNPLFVTLRDGSIRNGYTLKIINKGHATLALDLTIAGVPNASLSIIGYGDDMPKATLLADPEAVETFRVFVAAPADGLDGAVTDAEFVLTNVATGAVTRTDTVFRGPER